MKVTFCYNKEKDVWCLLNKGKSSSNSSSPTKAYQELVTLYGENPSADITTNFINTYLSEKKVDIEKYLDYYQKDWDIIADEYTKRAEDLFGISLPKDIIAYLTINNRCPYSIEENYFFVTVPTHDHVARKTVMHELWHFYTWYTFGSDQEEKLGKQKYNDLKEALTVLLNVECKDLLPEGSVDTGYVQHMELREKILVYWTKDRNISNLWNHLVN